MKDTVFLFVVTKCFKMDTHIILDREATKKTKLYKVGKKWNRNPE